MELDLNKILTENWVLLIFLVIALGSLLAKLRIGGVALGSTAGVLIVGLIFGHLGFPSAPGAATFGFMIFIFSVGLQAGPSFFSVFMQDGPRCIVLAVVVAATGYFLATFLARLLGLDYGMSAGLLAGALTSTPTLAGAQDALSSGLANLPDGMSAATATANVGTAYAITYLFGTVGLIVGIRFFPKILGIDLPAEAKQLAKERGLLPQKLRRTGTTIPIIRAYKISSDLDAVGQTIKQVLAKQPQGVKILKLRRGEEIFDADPALQLQAGDVVSILASLRQHADKQDNVGREIMDPELLNYQIVTREIIVTQAESAGKPLNLRGLMGDHACLAVGVFRSGIEIPAEEGVVINKGDRVTVSGEESAIERLAEVAGFVEEQMEDTDLITFSGGILVGGIIGTLAIKGANISIGLGSAGGLLLTGIVIGYLRSRHPTFGRVPTAARWLLMEFGLLLFMASVGLGAGAGIIEALKSVGIELFIAGVAVTLMPVVVAYTFGRVVLKMNPVLLLGAVTGAMTSTPALGAINDAAKSSVPSLGYAGTYTFANVFLTLAGTLMMTL